jgi:hypothetical protein
MRDKALRKGWSLADKNKVWGMTGIEPVTSRTQSENHNL